jgi:hypothetical protein
MIYTSSTSGLHNFDKRAIVIDNHSFKHHHCVCVCVCVCLTLSLVLSLFSFSLSLSLAHTHTHIQLERACDLKCYLDELARKGEIPEASYPSDKQWAVASSIKDVLEPFMQAQTLLEGQHYVTMSLVAMIIAMLSNGLQAILAVGQLEQGVLNVVQEVLDEVIKEWGSGNAGTVCTEHQTRGHRQRFKGLHLLHMVASFVDPRTKSMTFIPKQVCVLMLPLPGYTSLIV